MLPQNRIQLTENMCQNPSQQNCWRLCLSDVIALLPTILVNVINLACFFFLETIIDIRKITGISNVSKLNEVNVFQILLELANVKKSSERIPLKFAEVDTTIQ